MSTSRWPTKRTWRTPPKELGAEKGAYALAERHYERLKLAENGRLDAGIYTAEDLSFEMGVISSRLETHDDQDVRKWIDESAAAWVAEAAGDLGIPVNPCQGCKRITCQNEAGRFVCRGCERGAARAQEGGPT
jgi:hypothetical protein